MSSIQTGINHQLHSLGKNFESCANYCKNKYNNLPANTGKAVFTGFALTFALVTVISGSAGFGLACAGVAGLAALINGIATPFFKNLLAVDGHYDCLTKTGKDALCIYTASFVLSSVSGITLPVSSPILLIAAYNIFCQPPEGWNADSASCYVVI